MNVAQSPFWQAEQKMLLSRYKQMLPIDGWPVSALEFQFFLRATCVCPPSSYVSETYPKHVPLLYRFFSRQMVTAIEKNSEKMLTMMTGAVRCRPVYHSPRSSHPFNLHTSKKPPRSPLYSKAVRWLCKHVFKLYRYVPRNVYNQYIQDQTDA